MSLTKMAEAERLNAFFTSERIDELLNPYFSRDEIVRKWKETLTELKKPTTSKNLEWLAQKLRSDYHITPSAISSLFNRKYTDPVSDPSFDGVPKLRVAFNPISFYGTEKFEYSDEDFVSSLRKRLEYPILPDGVNRFNIGPTNSDLDSDLQKSKWCHEDEILSTDEDSLGLHHGMLTCQCNREIPEIGFTCEGCQGFFRWKSVGKDWFETDFIRFPIIDQNIGGWGGFYCSRSCLLEYPPEELTEMHDVILEAVDSILEDD